jgi:hypothetical protein
MISRTELLIMIAVLAVGTAVILLMLASGCISGPALP